MVASVCVNFFIDLDIIFDSVIYLVLVTFFHPLFFSVCEWQSYLISSMFLELLVKLQGDANHHLGLVPIRIRDVVQYAIKI